MQINLIYFYFAYRWIFLFLTKRDWVYDKLDNTARWFKVEEKCSVDPPSGFFGGLVYELKITIASFLIGVSQCNFCFSTFIFGRK